LALADCITKGFLTSVEATFYAGTRAELSPAKRD